MIVNVPLDRIQPNPWQTRLGDPDQVYIKELAMDIAKNSLMQTPVGRLFLDGKLLTALPQAASAFIRDYDSGIQVQLAFGHNRLAAYRWLNDLRENSDLLGDYTSMPIDLRQLDNQQMADYAWSENERRRDVTPIERAQAIQRRLADFSWTQQQCAEHLGISRPVISNALRLLKLPAEIQQALASSQISERVAIALAGLYDLPEALYKIAQESWGETRPSAIVKSALEGHLTSDKIRELTQSICTCFGQDLAKAGWGLDDIASARIDIAVLRSVTCRDCEQRIKDRNICLDRKCFTAREAAIARQYLEQASQASGIPVLDNFQERNAYDYMTSFNSWGHRQEGFDKKIIASGCQNLALVDRGYEDEDATDSVAGFQRAKVICTKRKGYCTCLSALEATHIVCSEFDEETRSFNRVEIPTDIKLESEQPTAVELSALAAEAKSIQKDARQYAKEIIQHVGEQIGDALAQRRVKAWKQLAAQVHYKCGQEEHDSAAIQDAIGRQFAEKALPYEYKTPLEVERAMLKLLEKFGADVDIEHFPVISAQRQAALQKSEAQSAEITAICKAENKTLLDLVEEGRL